MPDYFRPEVRRSEHFFQHDSSDMGGRLVTVEEDRTRRLEDAMDFPKALDQRSGILPE
jgi:hypothetical protein